MFDDIGLDGRSHEGMKKKNIFVTFFLTNSTAAPLDTVYIKYFRQLIIKLTKAAHSKDHRLWTTFRNTLFHGHQVLLGGCITPFQTEGHSVVFRHT